MDLAVGIALGDVIEVNQGKSPNRTARQRLGRPRTHATHTDHDHVGGTKARQRRRTVQAPHAGKAALRQRVERALGRSADQG